MRLIKIQVVKAAVPPHSSPEAEGATWDGELAVRRMREWAGVDQPDAPESAWRKYRDGFAWYDEDAPANYGSYKLPHHDVVDGRLSLVRQGLFAAGAALQGARGGVEIPQVEIAAVRAHLARHYRDLDLVAPWEQV